MGLIDYNLPAIADASAQIAQASAMTEENHQASLNLVNANADKFRGLGRDSFEQAITVVNAAYAQSQQAIQAASRAVEMAGGNMGEADQRMSGQY
jgi:uncharacterized protein YukE